MNQQLDQQRTGKARRAATFISIVVGVPAILLGVYMMTLGRSPLVGEDHHDFGVIQIVDEYGTVEGWAEHTFKLTNRSRRPVQINGVRSSCGCTATRFYPDIVEPGEVLEIGVVLTVSRNGLSEQNVYIEMAGRGIRTLSVQGVGRTVQQLRATREEITLISNRAQNVTVTADVWRDDLPDGQSVPLDLTVTAPEGIKAVISRWTQSQPRNPRQERPEVWSGQVELQALVDQVPEGAEVVFSMGEHTLAVPLRVMQPRQTHAADHADTDDEFNPLLFEPGTGAEPAPDDR